MLGLLCKLYKASNHLILDCYLLIDKEIFEKYLIMGKNIYIGLELIILVSSTGFGCKSSSTIVVIALEIIDFFFNLTVPLKNVQ